MFTEQEKEAIRYWFIQRRQVLKLFFRIMDQLK